MQELIGRESPHRDTLIFSFLKCLHSVPLNEVSGGVKKHINFVGR